MIFLQKILKIFMLASMLALTACVDLSEPAVQLQQNLSPSAAKIQRSGGQLKIILLTDHLFQLRTFRFTPRALHTLAQINRTLNMYPDLRVKLVGYTDSSGNPKKNQLISLRRAMLVADYFRDHGISSARISTVGLGSENPISTNANAQSRIQNRRIEIEFF